MHWLVPVLPARDLCFAFPARFFECIISPHGALLEGEVVHHIFFSLSQCTPLFLCVDSVVNPYGSLAFISFSIITRAIVGVAFLSRCVFAPESVIYSMLVIVGLGWVSI